MGPPRITYKAAKLQLAWTKGGPVVKMYGKDLPTRYNANKKGGMTQEEFGLFLDENVLPMFPMMTPDNPCWLFMDGDDSHMGLTPGALAKLEEVGKKGLIIIPPLPNTTADLQHADDGDGPLHTFQDHDWPAAKAAKRTELARVGLTHPLTNEDVPDLLSVAWPKGLGSKRVNDKAFENIGMGERFTRAPLWAAEVQATKDKALPERCKVDLDLKTIRFREDGAERPIDDVVVELYQQLGGRKFNTGKLWKFTLTEPDGIYIQRAWGYAQDKKKEAAEAKAQEKAAQKEAVVAAKATAEEEKAAAVVARIVEREERKVAKEKAEEEKAAVVVARKAAAQLAVAAKVVVVMARKVAAEAKKSAAPEVAQQKAALLALFMAAAPGKRAWMLAE